MGQINEWLSLYLVRVLLIWTGYYFMNLNISKEVLIFVFMVVGVVTIPNESLKKMMDILLDTFTCHLLKTNKITTTAANKNKDNEQLQSQTHSTSVLQNKKNTEEKEHETMNEFIIDPQIVAQMQQQMMRIRQIVQPQQQMQMGYGQPQMQQQKNNVTDDQKTRNFEELGEDCMSKILGFLNLADLVNFGQLSNYFKQFISKQPIASEFAIHWKPFVTSPILDNSFLHKLTQLNDEKKDEKDNNKTAINRINIFNTKKITTLFANLQLCDQHPYQIDRFQKQLKGIKLLKHLRKLVIFMSSPTESVYAEANYIKTFVEGISSEIQLKYLEINFHSNFTNWTQMEWPVPNMDMNVFDLIQRCNGILKIPLVSKRILPYINKSNITSLHFWHRSSQFFKYDFDDFLYWDTVKDKLKTLSKLKEFTCNFESSYSKSIRSDIRPLLINHIIKISDNTLTKLHICLSFSIDENDIYLAERVKSYFENINLQKLQVISFQCGSGVDYGVQLKHLQYLLKIIQPMHQSYRHKKRIQHVLLNVRILVNTINNHEKIADLLLKSGKYVKSIAVKYSDHMHAWGTSWANYVTNRLANEQHNGYVDDYFVTSDTLHLIFV